MTEQKCQYCGKSLADETIVYLECSTKPTCSQCYHDMEEMAAELNDMAEEIEQASEGWGDGY